MSDLEQPYVPANAEEIKTYPPFPFPDLCAFESDDWILTENSWFADSSGFGKDSEPALTIDRLKTELLTYHEDNPTHGFGITSIGQFQLYITAFAPPGLPDLDDFTIAYIECALWSTFEEDENLGFDNLHPDTLSAIKADCLWFQEENAEDITDANYNHARWSDDEMAGHDFWLTRNGHGAGYWDGELGDTGDRLTEASRRFGEVCLYVGDDGIIYC